MTAPTLEPLTVIDVRDQTWNPYTRADIFARLMEWARSQGIDPDQTYRVEIYLLDAPFARVYEMALDADGQRYLTDDGKDLVRREPYDVVLSSLPPEWAPEGTTP